MVVFEVGHLYHGEVPLQPVSEWDGSSAARESGKDYQVLDAVPLIVLGEIVAPTTIG